MADLTPYLARYIDQTLFDRDVPELVARALSDARFKVPGFDPKVGRVEVTWLEIVAAVDVEIIHALNRAPAALIAGMLRLHGVNLDQGAPPSGVAHFELTPSGATVARTIPAGTNLRLGTGDTALVLSTISDATAPAGQSSVNAGVIATTNGAAFNGTPAATPLEVLSPVAAVDTATLLSTLVGGRDPEGVLAWLERGINRFQRVSDVLAVARHFTAYALEQPGIAQAATYDRYNPSTGPAAGHVTVAVIGPSGSLLDAETKAALATAMGDLAPVNLAVHVINPTLTPIDIVVEIRKQLGFDDADVEANVRQALSDFLNPDTWPFDATVFHADLVAVINRAAGVQSATLTTPAADVALSGLAPLPLVSSSVTVVVS